ncbi:hypothetical protein ACIGC1_10475 [Peribacillus butanolivorans]|uniref:hypothetical protein n=1 Tax=Peribacillus butanolivorans TaxID=421767 RepID=UPI0037C6C4BD
MGRVIKSFKVEGEAFIYTFAVGKVYSGEVVGDIIEHDGVFKLFNRKDELITEIHLPVISVKYEHIGGELIAKKDIDHSRTTHTLKTGYPNLIVQPEHAGIDYYANEILVADSIVIDKNNGEVF